MLNTKSFLTVDFGAGSLKLAEFEINEAGGLRLNNFAIKPLGLEGAQEATREKADSLDACRRLIAEKGLKAKSVNVCAPGFHVFSKFVKLPPVDAGKVDQIIQYEAQQNVPFPAGGSGVGLPDPGLGRRAASWKCCWSPSSPTLWKGCSAWRPRPS